MGRKGREKWPAANKFKMKVETRCQVSGIASRTRSKTKQEPRHLQNSFPPAHDNDFSDDSGPNAQHNSVLKRVTATIPPEEKKNNWKMVDTSTEQGAALVWPRSNDCCKICQVCHVTIPNSTVSDHCVRISILIQDEPGPARDQIRHQSMLVPTDTYESSLLGWLIWSTFAHRVAMRDAKRGRVYGKRSKDWIYTETGGLGKDRPVIVVGVRHRSQRVFESWWGGHNLNRRRGRQWLTITFPWNMGDFNILDANFGSVGYLFSFPSPQRPVYGRSGEPIARVAETGRRKKKKDFQLAGSEEDAEMSEDKAGTSGNDENVKKYEGKGEKGKEDRDDFSGHIASIFEHAKGQNGPQTPAFHLYRDNPSSSSDESSQGNDNDFG